MIYTIHMKSGLRTAPPSGEAEDIRFDDVVAVPETLAKWALIAPPLWLAWHRLWFSLAIYCLVAAFMFGLITTSWFAIPLFLSGLPGLYLLLEGYQLRRYNLDKRGYEVVGVADAIDETMAIEKFLADWEDPQPFVATPNEIPKTSIFQTKLNSPVQRPASPQASQGFGMFGGWEN